MTKLYTTDRIMITKKSRRNEMLIYPKAYIENVTKITIDFLRKNNIEALILDVDNTLIDTEKKLLKRSQRVV